MKPPLVYVAGPITSNPYGCIRQATAAFDAIRLTGAVPFLPQLSVLHAMVRDIGYEGWLAYDFDVIRNCAAVVRLEGVSAGADRETAFAHELGLPVFAVPADWSLFERWTRELVA